MMDSRLCMLSNKWVALAGAIWVLLVDGGGYNFGLYSEAVKQSLGYSQRTVSTIAFCRDIGANLGIHCGILYNQFGPRVVLLVAACLNFTGYFIIWLIVVHKLTNPGVVVMSILFFVLANSQAFGFTCAMITSVKNFPENRGMVIGVVTAFVGVSGAVLALIFEAFYKQKTASYLLFNAWFASGVFILCTPLMRIVDCSNIVVDKQAESRKFSKFSIFCFFTAGYCFIVILFKVVLHVPYWLHCTMAAVLLVSVLLVPFLIIVLDQEDDKSQNIEAVRAQNEDDKEADEIGPRRDFDPSPEVTTSNNSKGSQRGQNFTIWQALRSLDMWLIFLASSCGIGSVLAAIDNLGQIGAAWGYSTHQVTNSVSFNSIWNFLGRVGAGWISEILLHKYGVPRPLVFAIVLVMTAAGHLVIVLKPAAALLLASAFEGFALGALLTLIFTMTSEIFGLKNFAVLYSMGTFVSTTLGTYLLSVLLAGNLFDKESRHQNRDRICFGVECYRKSFEIMIGACLLGSFLALFLAARTRHFYKELQSRATVT